jgi:uncharacterized protein YndB with AHSA1/START domain
MEATVRITRTFAAPRERVFRAWTSAEEFLRWFGNPGDVVRIVRFDAREGGRYDVEGEFEGELWRVAGVWKELRPPERLVFTWRSSLERPKAGRDAGEHPGSGETIVTVDFFERGGRTELVLEHRGFTEESSRREHDEGWKGCLDRIAALVA